MTLPLVDLVMVRLLAVMPAFLFRGVTPDAVHRRWRTRRMIRRLDAGRLDQALDEVWHGADPNAPGRDGSRLLLRLIADAPLWMVEGLLKCGADPNGRGADGLLPIESVLMREDARDVIQALVKGGADVDALTRNGRPLIVMAIEQECVGGAIGLITAGSRLDQCGGDGWSAMDLLRRRASAGGRSCEPYCRLLYYALRIDANLARLSDRDVLLLSDVLDPLQQDVAYHKEYWGAEVLGVLMQRRPTVFPYRAPSLPGITLTEEEMRGVISWSKDPGVRAAPFLASWKEKEWVAKRKWQDEKEVSLVQDALRGWLPLTGRAPDTDLLNWRPTISHETEIFREAPWSEHRRRAYGAFVPVSDLEPGVARLVKALNALMAETSLSCAGHDAAPTGRIWFSCGYSVEWAKVMTEITGAADLGFAWVCSYDMPALQVHASSHTELLGRTLVLAERLLKDGEAFLEMRETVIRSLPKEGVRPQGFGAALRAHWQIAQLIAAPRYEGG